MKKKAVTLAISALLCGAALTAGTLAYLTDTDAEKNVMTLGSVSIQQNEYQRATTADGSYQTDPTYGYLLEDYQDGKPLLPAIIPNGGSVDGTKWDYDSTMVTMSQVGSYGAAGVFNTPNALDKFVTVKNTGKSDAFVRTIIAYEVGTADRSKLEDPKEFLIGLEVRAAAEKDNANRAQPWTFGYEGYITVNGNTYFAMELIYTGAGTNSDGTPRHPGGVLPADDTTYPSLCQVYLASRATNEDVAAIDGDKDGKFDILVLSQAVQAEGFTSPKLALDTAFGAVTGDTAAAWLTDVKNAQ